MSASEQEFYLYPDGKRVRVSREVYEEYYHGKRKERYFMEDLKRGKTIVNQEEETVSFIPGREDSYERLLDLGQQFPVPGELLEDKVLTTILLSKALKTLTSEERELIRELFYLGKTERQVSETLNMAKTTLHRQSKRILDKLKGLLE